MLSTKLFIFILCSVGFVVGEIKNKGWWKNAIFYQVYPRSFMDADNNGIGDIKGITNRLEHFVESGVDGIWLSPIYSSPMIDFGYDISNFTEIDEAYGTLENLEELTQKAKKLGIKVILDFVPNHSSNKHNWFIQSSNNVEQYADYYVWRKGRSNNTKPPNNWISVFGGPAWSYDASRDAWYLHQFDYRQPDLNYASLLLRQEMENVLKFWLSKGIDGFRIDAVPYFYENDDFPDEPLSHIEEVTDQQHDYLIHIYTMNDPRNYDLMRSWRKVVDDWSESHDEDEKVIMSEAYSSLENVLRFYEYGSNIPFNFNLLGQVNSASNASDFKEAIEEWLSAMPRNEVANWVVGNHDNSRIATRYPGRFDQMTMLTMILPGIAVTYYGDEIGMVDKTDISWEETQDPQACNTDPEHYQAMSRDPFRTPFQWDDTQNAGFSKASSTWLPVNDNYKHLNLAQQKSEPQSHYKLYQVLTKLKHTSEALEKGSLKVDLLNNEAILAVVRETSAETIILLINFSNDTTETVNIADYLSTSAKSKIIAASVGSDFKWESPVKSSKIDLPPKVSIVIGADTGSK